MNIGILRRIAAIEQKVKRSEEPPTLIMIHYDDHLEKWRVTAHYTSGNWRNPNDYRTETSLHGRLQDFFFPTEFHGRIILNTFGSPDSAIYKNLFTFDVDDLREGQEGEFAIQSITAPPDETSNTVQINTCTK